MTPAAIAIGSNLGDRRSYLEMGVAGLRQLGEIVAASPLFETAPVGGPDQGAYFNAVIVLETALDARQLLRSLHRIEAAADRTREIRWGPRTLDLDLIYYGDDVISARGISVPHPRLHQRRFVLEPLLAAWPDVRDPRGRDLESDLAALSDQPLSRVEGPEWAARDDPPTGTAGGPPSRDRGAPWVIAQMALLALTAYLSIARRGELPGSLVLPLMGGLLAAAGVVLGVAGTAALGSNLTPLPEPVQSGHLVQRGAYRMVRHPIYGAVTLVAVGVPMLTGSVWGLAAGVVTGFFFYSKAGFEERRLVRVYPDYPAYQAATPRRLVPWIL